MSFPSGGPAIEIKRACASGAGRATEFGAGDFRESRRLRKSDFEWQPVDDAVSYTLRISSTTMFTKLVKEVKSRMG